MKAHIEELLHTALKAIPEIQAILPPAINIQVELTKDKQFGDYASNVALVLAKSAKMPPRLLAEKIIQAIPESKNITKIEVAGPGFINFYIEAHAFANIIKIILTKKDTFGHCEIGRKKRVLIEYLSSNPTGPLHVGHGRHAAFGTVVANLLTTVGFDIYKEYYVNDAGRQMNILTVSVWMRYLTLLNENVPFPANAYQGDYITAIAKEILGSHEKTFYVAKENVLAKLPADEAQGGDKEIYIDAVIDRARSTLGDKYEILFTLALKGILADIREDLAEFGVQYDNWFSERSLVASGMIEKTLEDLKAHGFTYMQDGALWFAASKLGDEKDRVLIRSNGQKTYFTNDVGYHISKFARGFDIAIDIFGSDHHGYVSRMKAAMQAAKINPERLMYLLVQFVTLYRNGEQVQMSTRSGNFVTLRELRQEVGNDAARYFYVMRKYEQHMDFDLDLAKAKNNENPVYYVQYAYARICSVFRQLAERQLAYDEGNGLANLSLLIAKEERQLLNTLARYPDMIVSAALQYEPHQLTNYLRELATDFHAYYNSNQFLVEDNALRDARLALVTATRQTLVNGFTILGISAPEQM